MYRTNRVHKREVWCSTEDTMTSALYCGPVAAGGGLACDMMCDGTFLEDGLPNIRG